MNPGNYIFRISFGLERVCDSVQATEILGSVYWAVGKFFGCKKETNDGVMDR